MDVLYTKDVGTLQKNWSKATFLKRGYNSQKREYRSIYPIATFSIAVFLSMAYTLWQ